MTKSPIKLTVLLLALACSFSVQAQTFQGKAFFKSHREVNISMDSTKISPERQAAMKAMMESQFNKDFVLLFSQQQSSFKEQEKLGGPTTQSGGMVVVGFSDASSELYKNTKEKRYTSRKDLFGKDFLIKDKLETYDWKLTNESKQIGQYSCYKATTTISVEGSVSIDDKGNETIGEPREIPVTAWYTPDIPVSNGPDSYWGLPGLILEIKDGNRTMICTKVVLNSDDKEVIQEPSKGKQVTEAEYEKLMTEKMLEMNKMNKGGKQKDGSHTMTFTIDG